MTALRILNLLIWGGLFLYMLPGAYSAIWGKSARRGDPMRLGVFSVCIVMICGNLRWLLAPDSDELFAAIYVFNAGVGLYIFWLGYSYGRGPRV